MSLRSQSSRKSLFVIPVAVLASVLFVSSIVLGEPPAASRASESVSVGTPMKGSLLRGQVLPKKGRGYVHASSARERRARFGVLELVMLVKDAAVKVRREHRGSILKVADLSARKGGRIEHHGSHQNGRDVDLFFFMKDMKGDGAASAEFIPFDANGYSTEPPMKYQFDTARNWTLVESLLRSKRATVQWIFVADHLKELMLAHAEKIGASKRLRNMAKSVLHQPGKKAHMDHFHVRIYCPPGDKPKCKDVGPRWAWAR